MQFIKVTILSVFILSTVVLKFTGCSGVKVDGIRRIDNKQFATKMEKPDFIVLDVRTPREYDSARLEGAVLINVLDTASFTQKIEELDKDKKILVYCRTGKRSMTAARILKEHGFKHIYDLENGIKGWTGPTISGTNQ